MIPNTASDSENPKESDEKPAAESAIPYAVKNRVTELRYRLRMLTIGMRHLDDLCADEQDIYYHSDFRPLMLMLEDITDQAAALHADVCAGGDRSALQF